MDCLVRLRPESGHETGCGSIKRLSRRKKIRVVVNHSAVRTSTSVMICFALGVEGITKESIEPYEEEISMLESVRSLAEEKDSVREIRRYPCSHSRIFRRSQIIHQFFPPLPSRQQVIFVNVDGYIDMGEQIEFVRLDCWASRVRKSNIFLV
jgi:hypothetical protein